MSTTKKTQPGESERKPREYPHQSGDRNTQAPLDPDNHKVFEGGTQRKDDSTEASKH